MQAMWRLADRGDTFFTFGRESCLRAVDSSLIARRESRPYKVKYLIKVTG